MGAGNPRRHNFRYLRYTEHGHVKVKMTVKTIANWMLSTLSIEGDDAFGPSNNLKQVALMPVDWQGQARQ
jgi:hypothetical protein